MSRLFRWVESRVSGLLSCWMSCLRYFVELNLVSRVFCRVECRVSSVSSRWMSCQVRCQKRHLRSIMFVGECINFVFRCVLLWLVLKLYLSWLRDGRKQKTCRQTKISSPMVIWPARLHSLFSRPTPSPLHLTHFLTGLAKCKTAYYFTRCTITVVLIFRNIY